MTLHIRQIVLAARDLERTVEHIEAVLGVSVCYRDPEVAKFGLRNALFAVGHQGIVQFLEVVSPIERQTAAGRHLDRHGDSGYMLILQTDDLARERARLNRLGVRIVWEATHDDVSAVHLHPKDIGAAIVSLDQPIPPESWRWAGPQWRNRLSKSGAQRVCGVTIAARDPMAMTRRWSEVLATPIADSTSIELIEGALQFIAADADVIAGFDVSMPNAAQALERAGALGLRVDDDAVTIAGAKFRLR